MISLSALSVVKWGVLKWTQSLNFLIKFPCKFTLFPLPAASDAKRLFGIWGTYLLLHFFWLMEWAGNLAATFLSLVFWGASSQGSPSSWSFWDSQQTFRSFRRRCQKGSCSLWSRMLSLWGEFWSLQFFRRTSLMEAAGLRDWSQLAVPEKRFFDPKGMRTEVWDLREGTWYYSL